MKLSLTARPELLAEYFAVCGWLAQHAGVKRVVQPESIYLDRTAAVTNNIWGASRNRPRYLRSLVIAAIITALTYVLPMMFEEMPRWFLAWHSLFPGMMLPLAGVGMIVFRKTEIFIYTADRIFFRLLLLHELLHAVHNNNPVKLLLNSLLDVLLLPFGISLQEGLCMAFEEWYRSTKQDGALPLPHDSEARNGAACFTAPVKIFGNRFLIWYLRYA